MMRRKLKRHYPLDIFLISGHMHMGAGTSHSLMELLRRHPAVRRYGMCSYMDGGRYDEQAIRHIRANRVNTIFIDPGNTGEMGGFDAGVFIPHVRTEFPDVVFVLYTWNECRERFVKVHPRFEKYFYLPHLYVGEDDSRPTNPMLDAILNGCEEWHRTRYEFDVAISFAGEDRSYAEGIASRLMRKGARVFYDADRQSALLGVNLHDRLWEVYSRRARYCVMLTSAAYVSKMWTSHERKAAQERSMNEQGAEYILQIKVDDTPVPGLSETMAHLHVGQGLRKLVEVIAGKLWTNPHREKEYVGARLY